MGGNSVAGWGSTDAVSLTCEVRKATWMKAYKWELSRRRVAPDAQARRRKERADAEWRMSALGVDATVALEQLTLRGPVDLCGDLSEKEAKRLRSLAEGGDASDDHEPTVIAETGVVIELEASGIRNA